MSGYIPSPEEMQTNELAYNEIDDSLSLKITSDTVIPILNTSVAYTGYKNILINGDFRINQRGFDGNWAGAPSWNIGYDRWYKHPDGYLYQLIEEGNYKPNTIYTLSGTNIVAQQVVSPTSGPWNMGAISAIGEISYTATDIQLEEGSIATSFEQIPIGETLSLCQRYYQIIKKGPVLQGRHADNLYSRGNFSFNTEMRASPSTSYTTTQNNSTWDDIAMYIENNSGDVYARCITGATEAYANIDYTNIKLDAEI